VQRYGYVPFFSVTDIVVDWPRPIVLDVWPAIAKSCSVAPMFLMTNFTRPADTLLVDRANRYSLAVTLTV